MRPAARRSTKSLAGRVSSGRNRVAQDRRANACVTKMNCILSSSELRQALRGRLRHSRLWERLRRYVATAPERQNAEETPHANQKYLIES